MRVSVSSGVEGSALRLLRAMETPPKEPRPIGYAAPVPSVPGE